MHDFLSEVGLGTERARLEGTQINVENESRKMHKDIFRSHFFFLKKKFTYRTIVKTFSLPF